MNVRSACIFFSCYLEKRTVIRRWIALYDHVLKMFSVYLKQSLRGHDAQKGLSNLYAEIFEKPCEHDRLMITEIYSWMKRHAENRHQEYVDSFARFLHF